MVVNWCDDSLLDAVVLDRLIADNVSEDEFYSILKATGIGLTSFLNL